MVIYLYSIGHNYTAAGLAFYSLVISGRVDYITRFGLLKKNGQCASFDNHIGFNCWLKIIWFYDFDLKPIDGNLFYNFYKKRHLLIITDDEYITLS